MMIKIKDAYMGYGKTTGIIEQINLNPSNKYLVVTPFLTEIERYKTSCPELKFIEPSDKLDGTKINSLRSLLKNQKNIATTHSCFSKLIESDIELLKEYTLVLDEVLDVINIFDIKKGDLKAYLQKGIVTKVENNRLEWTAGTDDSEEYSPKLRELKSICDLKMAYLIKDSLLVWEFPKTIFEAFKDVEILTYLFETSFMAQYFKYNKVEYTIERVDDTEFRTKALSLINLYKGKRNDFANNARALSKNWTLKLTKEEAKAISTNVVGWFKHDCDNDSKLNGWTTFKKAKQSLKGKGYTKGFIPCNCKGTNEFADLQSMAYLLNVYIKPEFMEYFTTLGLDYSQDDFALSMLIQWIWRSRIRNGETINLFLPSSRMRTIFTNYLNAKVSKPNLKLEDLT
ncbi:MAG: DEAD/DEAH box helicase family protein [Cetobacterium sp.]